MSLWDIVLYQNAKAPDTELSLDVRHLVVVLGCRGRS